MKSNDTELSEVVDNSPIVITPYLPEHMLKINPQEAQKDFLSSAPDGFIDSVNIEGLTKTIFDRKNEIISVCGLLPWQGHGVTWSIHSDLFKEHAFAVTRFVKNFFSWLASTGEYPVLIGSVDADFEQGHRWMRILGFKRNDDLTSIYGNSQILYESCV